jgi:hypothetical protein
MRQAARTDNNHAEVRKALRDAGATVEDLSAVGKGCPDLLAGWRGWNFLFEVKDGSKPPSHRVLTVDQKEWHATWGGQVNVVTSGDEAVAVMVAWLQDYESELAT